jgi:hypothetical protein
MDTKNLEWKIEPAPDGSLPPEQITHALLVDIRANTRLLFDIREAARSTRRMMMFFTVLTVINCAILFFWAVSH